MWILRIITRAILPLRKYDLFLPKHWTTFCRGIFSSLENLTYLYITPVYHSCISLLYITPELISLWKMLSQFLIALDNLTSSFYLQSLWKLCKCSINIIKKLLWKRRTYWLLLEKTFKCLIQLFVQFCCFVCVYFKVLYIF